tara:strand:+ start:3072 stop:3878 length:807 start_codon:yes stop_codon:yes gene_type:complete
MSFKRKITLKNGDCLKELKKIKDGSVDQIYADPPYNLSGKTHQTVQSGKPVTLNKGDWDVIDDIDEFNLNWVSECIRVLSDNGTIWISGTLHNHPSIGTILKKLGLWIINDVVWYKRNAPPLLSGNRLAPSVELIWVASKSKKYFFNYELGKILNDGKQMRNLWEINAQRHLTKHPTEKPENLIERIILLGSKKDQVILDPFMGSGTTGVVAKRLSRKFIGIELDKEYFDISKERISNVNSTKVILTDKKLILDKDKSEQVLKNIEDN